MFPSLCRKSSRIPFFHGAVFLPFPFSLFDVALFFFEVFGASRGFEVISPEGRLDVLLFFNLLFRSSPFSVASGGWTTRTWPEDLFWRSFFVPLCDSVNVCLLVARLLILFFEVPLVSAQKGNIITIITVIERNSPQQGI